MYNIMLWSLIKAAVKDSLYPVVSAAVNDVIKAAFYPASSALWILAMKVAASAAVNVLVNGVIVIIQSLA